MAPATKGGMHFRRPQGGCMVFPRAKPGCMVFAAEGGVKNGARKGAYLASAAVLYNSRGRSPQTVREASAGPGQNLWRPGPSGPAAPSTLARRASTFGNTGKRRFLTKAHDLKCRTQQKSTSHQTSAFSVNQQLPILPGRFQPSTFGVCELNYRVRHGYGCILTAIATESLRVCSLKTA